MIKLRYSLALGSASRPRSASGGSARKVESMSSDTCFRRSWQTAAYFCTGSEPILIRLRCTRAVAGYEPPWLRPSPALPGALARPQPGFNANASVLASYEDGASDRVGVNVGFGSKALHMEAERCHAEGESHRSFPTRSRPLTLNAGRPNPGPG